MRKPHQRVLIRRRFAVAISGIVSSVASEWSLRFQSVAFVFVVVTGFVFRISALEWCAVILCSGAVIVAELFNTALEHLADAVHPERDPGIGRAKDASAGAVLIAAVAAALVGAIVFLPKIWELSKTLLNQE